MLRIHCGDRVRRGIDWKWGDQDGGRGRLGTVVALAPSGKTGWYKVQWDSGEVQAYRYNNEDCYDLDIVESRPMHGVGDRVTRGPDWKWGKQDGGAGSFGVVTARATRTEWIQVRWDNGSSNCYRFGEQGCYDLTVHTHAPS
mmetsp:Transcript_15791/g.53583  ORF Transcript_15791/g.53583 Transcript_15791/m.53583 type:complete len:142 (+) Transcript_15791:387-812(+)